MNKTDFIGEKSLHDEDGGIQHPIPLQYDGKKQPIDYLKHSNVSKQNKENNLDVKTDKPEKKKYKNIKLSYEPIKPNRKQNNPQSQKKNDKLLKDKNDDSDKSDKSCLSDCSSECQCAKDLIPKKRVEIKFETKKRRKHKDITPFYEQSILDIHRIRRINFVHSSSGSSLESSVEIVKFRTIKYEKTLKNKESRTEMPTNRSRVQLDETQQQPQQLSKSILKTEPKSQKESAVRQTTIFSKPVREQQNSKNPKITKYVDKPKGEEWAKYETPDIVHPQPLKLPSKRQEPTQPSKPLYKKMRGRVPMQKLETPPPQIKYAQKALPTQDEPQKTGNKMKKSKKQKMSSSSVSDCCYECECLSDCC